MTYESLIRSDLESIIRMSANWWLLIQIPSLITTGVHIRNLFLAHHWFLQMLHSRPELKVSAYIGSKTAFLKWCVNARSGLENRAGDSYLKPDARSSLTLHIWHINHSYSAFYPLLYTFVPFSVPWWPMEQGIGKHVPSCSKAKWEKKMTVMIRTPLQTSNTWPLQTNLLSYGLKGLNDVTAWFFAVSGRKAWMFFYM